MKFLAENSSPFLQPDERHPRDQILFLLASPPLLFIVFRLLFKRVKIVATLYYTFYHTLWTIAKVQVDVRSVNMNKWVKCINKDFEQTLCSPKYQAITVTRLGSYPFPSVRVRWTWIELGCPDTKCGPEIFWDFDDPPFNTELPLNAVSLKTNATVFQIWLKMLLI